ncbi:MULTISPECIES: antiviral reverse transcriptase Drt3a [unclassified Sphingobium]|uniref:antiviral reverse transcriptase Drt3a n=1 Tax=unclassified Sphingobium TaxID=2611147 RepID=UPI0007704DCF|nr:MULTISPECIES: antiviral reverse transcriptase Drt3a [unclassified Sphingobium]AMK22349.1 phage-related reverse [Sphingobium sp. TKS]NML91209.1 RNA-directed DNA polymerase [Sphingobium sp. TB-6]
MHDPTIHPKSITRQFRSADFIKDPTLLTPDTLKQVVNDAVRLGCSGFDGVAIKSSDLRGKSIYQIDGLAPQLVLRHITSNIRRITGVKQDDRQFIVNCIKKLGSEGTSFRVYKFDVKSFYETVPIDDVLKMLERDLAFSGQSVRALSSLFADLGKLGVAGLPRGMAISATLSEYLMRKFDRIASSTTGVWYYSRFVDDIIIITDGREDEQPFKVHIEAALPKGLRFNEKSRCYAFGQFNGAKMPSDEHSFDFLGYHFAVSCAFRGSDNKIRREVKLDLAPSKVNKIKTRIAKSLIQYKADNNFADLRDRVRLLTSNFSFEDRVTGAKRNSGVYFNYPLITEPSSGGLRALDKFLRNSIISSTPKNKLFPALGPVQEKEVIRLSFVHGHIKKRFFSFDPKRLAHLTGCWFYA